MPAGASSVAFVPMPSAAAAPADSAAVAPPASVVTTEGAVLSPAPNGGSASARTAPLPVSATYSTRSAGSSASADAPEKLAGDASACALCPCVHSSCAPCVAAGAVRKAGRVRARQRAHAPLRQPHLKAGKRQAHAP